MEIRIPQIEEADPTVKLVLRAFDEFIAPDYGDEGIAHFYAHITTPDLIAAIENCDIVLVAAEAHELAGVVRVRDESHVSWLYVDKKFQRRGIGRHLVRRAAEEIKARTPLASEITLNSSPYAAPIYQRMGFTPAGPDMTKNGMRMTPMRANIETLLA